MSIMKKKKVIGAVALGTVVLAATAYFVLKPKTDSNIGIYAQKVSTLTGMDVAVNRYSGVVESQETTDMNADPSKKIMEVYVTEGQEVKAGDKLFTYDVTEATNNIASGNLEIESINNTIESLNNEIASLNTQMQQVSPDEKFQYTTEISSKQMELRQNQFDIQSKKNELERLQKEIDHATVVSTIDGVVKSVHPEGGTDETGKTNPIVSIMQNSDFRVKGTVDEMSLGTLTEGSSVIIRSRVDESKLWKGTISKIETEPKTDANDPMSMGQNSGDSSSKYPFYAALDSSDSLMLGQHVFIELDEGQEQHHNGLWLDSSFIVTEDNGSFVWVSENGKLKKRTVQLGETDEDAFLTEITSGLKKEDYICWPDETYQEGMKTYTDSEKDGKKDAIGTE